MSMQAQDIDDFYTLLCDAEDMATTDWEMDFVSDMKEKYEQYGGQMYVTEKQVVALERIADY
jgi:hypothetical protein